MGQVLSEPVTDKATQILSSDSFIVGSSSMQGWRVSMEDCHTLVLSLPDDEQGGFFAVYDGHGGDSVAKFASKNFYEQLLSCENYKSGNIEKALHFTCMKIDEMFRAETDSENLIEGCTAVIVLIRMGKVYCCNVGDSRAIACVGRRVVELSNDHKPENKDESKRIYNAGGWVSENRVNGNLALSRALGDFYFKSNSQLSAAEQIVTAVPEIRVFDLTDEWQFIILACDGIWDVVNNEQALVFICDHLIDGNTPEKVCEALLSFCIASDSVYSGPGCDNMTSILVCFRTPDKSFDTYRENLKSISDVELPLSDDDEEQEQYDS